MMRTGENPTLALMNAAVGLLMVVPLLFLVLAQVRARADVERDLRLQQIQALQLAHQASRQRSDQPPIITISDAEVYSFPSGRADVSPGFQQHLTLSIIPKLARLAGQYRCDVIEVIGHTDARPVGGASNLDQRLDVTGGDVSRLAPGSNADLGLMRAWSVNGLLRADPRLTGMRFYGYSAGQAVLPDGRLGHSQEAPVDDPTRRRIEIRLRRSTQ